MDEEFDYGISWLNKAREVNESLYPKQDDDHWIQSFGKGLQAFGSGMLASDSEHFLDSLGTGGQNLDAYLQRARELKSQRQQQLASEKRNSFLNVARLLKPSAQAQSRRFSRSFKREQMQHVNNLRHQLLRGERPSTEDLELGQIYLEDLNRPEWRVVGTDEYGNTKWEEVPGSGFQISPNYLPFSMDDEDMGAWLKLPETLRGMSGPGYTTTLPSTTSTEEESDGSVDAIIEENQEAPLLDTPSVQLPPVGDLTGGSDFPRMRPQPDPNESGMPDIQAVIEANQPQLPRMRPDAPIRPLEDFGGSPLPIPPAYENRRDYSQEPIGNLRPLDAGKGIEDLINQAQGEFQNVLPEQTTTPRWDIIPGLPGVLPPEVEMTLPADISNLTPPTLDEIGVPDAPAESGIAKTIPRTRLQDMPATDSEVRPGNPGAPTLEQIVNDNQEAPAPAEQPSRHSDDPVGREMERRLRGREAAEGKQNIQAPIQGARGSDYSVDDVLNADMTRVNNAPSLDTLSDAEVARLAMENPQRFMELSRATREAARERGKGKVQGEPPAIGSTRKLNSQELKDRGNLISAIRQLGEAQRLVLNAQGEVDGDLFTNLKLGYLGRVVSPEAQVYRARIGGVFPLLLNLRTGAAFNDNELQAVLDLLEPELFERQGTFETKLNIAMDELTTKLLNMYNLSYQDIRRGTEMPSVIQDTIDGLPANYVRHLGADRGNATGVTEGDIQESINRLWE